MTRLLGIAALSTTLSIMAGAFAAHGLKAKIEPYYLQVFEKGAYYHLTQSLGLILIILIGKSFEISAATKIYLLLLAGIIIFSGSLYLLALTQIKWLGAITPIGGTLMIAAWIWLGIKLLSS